jgi:hypothetical protein
MQLEDANRFGAYARRSSQSRDVLIAVSLGACLRIGYLGSITDGLLQQGKRRVPIVTAEQWLGCGFIIRSMGDAHLLTFAICLFGHLLLSSVPVWRKRK